MDENLQGSSDSTLGACRSSCSGHMPIWSCPSGCGYRSPGALPGWPALGTLSVVSRPGPLRPYIEDTVLQKNELRCGFRQKHRQGLWSWRLLLSPSLWCTVCADQWSSYTMDSARKRGAELTLWSSCLKPLETGWKLVENLWKLEIKPWAFGVRALTPRP